MQTGKHLSNTPRIVGDVECPVHAIRFYLGADMGGMGSLVHTEKEGDILRWIVERTDGTTTEIRVNQKESNQY